MTKIILIRGKKVMLDSVLAQLYGVELRSLNQAVKRNIERFPDDFMFQLTAQEQESLRSQIVTLKRGQHRKYLPFVFTEQGVAMLSSVLNSKRAVHVNIQIMRTFIKLREVLLTHKDLQRKLEDIINKYGSKLKEHDEQIRAIFDAISRLLEPPDDTVPKKKYGFLANRGR